MTYKTKRPLYWLWCGMRGRCSNPNHAAWKWYGGKGIKVCDRWQTYENFEADMGPRPEGKTLDRINGDGDYSPDNCRWATHKEQGRNKSDVVRVTIEGQSYLLIELAEISGHKADTIAARVARGLTYAEVIDPKRKPSPEQWRGTIARNRAMAEKTHCKHGHEFTPENTIRYGNQKKNRQCRQCHSVTVARYKARQKAKKFQVISS